MRILVLSDSHGYRLQVQQAILAQPTAELVIHLGDGAQEALWARRNFPEKEFLLVRGNCDLGSDLPAEGEYTVEREGLPRTKLFFTHGHLYGVKSGLYQAVAAARDRGAGVLLYGHTHQAYESYEDGLYILNPGSASGYQASYGIVDITPQGVVTNVIRLP